MKHGCLARFGFYLVFFGCLTTSMDVFAREIRPHITPVPSLLLDDFFNALNDYSLDKPDDQSTKGKSLWLRSFKKLKIDPTVMRRRLEKGLRNSSWRDFLSKYRTITLEEIYDELDDSKGEDYKTALHGFRFDVKDEYDDVTNDDIYLYFITTYEDMMWGNVSAIYKNLDEGTSVFLTPEDRGIFGPNGSKVEPTGSIVVDFGIIESDGDDIKELQKLSDAIIDLAVAALTVYNPEAGVSAARARAETKNLLRAIIELDHDDRLVNDTLHLKRKEMRTSLADSNTYEFARHYEHSTFWTRYDYKLYFRLLR